MLELYQAYADYNDMMDITEAMTTAAIERIGGGFKRKFADQELDFTPPWPRHKYSDLLREYAGVDPRDADAVRDKAAHLGIDHGCQLLCEPTFANGLDVDKQRFL